MDTGTPMAATMSSSWSEAEDAVLREQVRLHGGQSWEGVSAALPGRSARSCLVRWYQHLASGAGAAGGPFSAGEDAFIVAYHRANPNKWATIARLLPGRAASDIKNRWNTVLREQLDLAAQPPRRHQDGTLPLFPLVPGDVRRPSGRGGAVLRRQPADEAAGDDQSGACLALFPLAPGDLTKGSSNSAREEAAMGVDVSAGGLPEMRLSSAQTAMAAFRAMVQAVRAP